MTYDKTFANYGVLVEKQMTGRGIHSGHPDNIFQATCAHISQTEQRFVVTTLLGHITHSSTAAVLVMFVVVLLTWYLSC